jgi:hypothetical protein
MVPPLRKPRTEGTVVRPRSKENIAANARAVRQFLKLEARPYFPVPEVYEALELLFDGARFEVWDEVDMGDDHGRTYPDRRLIRIRNDVYERACNGEARDRFTMCHELGHLVMHRGIALARIDPAQPPKIYCNSEWQADTFASYLMMPPELISGYESVSELVDVFGVSWEAAWVRRDELKTKNV